MARRAPDSSDEEDRPVKAPAHRAGDDSTNGARSRRDCVPSSKQDTNNKENLAAMELKFLKMQKEIETARRRAGKEAAPSAPARDDNEYESEERDSDSGGNPHFHSSIKPSPALPVDPPRPAMLVRKVKAVKGPLQTSSRAFLTLPEAEPEVPRSPSAGLDLDDAPDNDDTPLLHDAFDETPDPRRPNRSGSSRSSPSPSVMLHEFEGLRIVLKANRPPGAALRGANRRVLRRELSPRWTQLVTVTLC
ncbi:hypothetical protein C8R46DRAFT_1038811 [Mycena filopes]|nr:hypothetical protein C8R46DRAFT_1038811 [Mycena filopes]